MKYRKRPVVIEAIQWNGVNTAEVLAFAQDKARHHKGMFSPNAGMPGHQIQALFIETLEGAMRADVSDWIIRGVAGELYPCKPDIFEATYESVEE